MEVYEVLYTVQSGSTAKELTLRVLAYDPESAVRKTDNCIQRYAVHATFTQQSIKHITSVDLI